ncbi:hypothetical protein PoB_003180900 [Plakobranchus ocellatus]|uniref:Uncharacterized protein n=1 Tax=Plakobranchus ocellatus TaxID=259542 RepID=A0AAV4AFU3_9GAST|nr:hypothetical protein PoB_003180900 [Plakobranchus ocellatus]
MTLELWIPYVVIGVSCVLFLAVHFWCYHKRNRIRYLRKREESRVKNGLFERRRITTLMVARYQSELGIIPNSKACHPAGLGTWDKQQLNSAQTTTEDTVDIIIEGVLAPTSKDCGSHNKNNKEKANPNLNKLYSIDRNISTAQNKGYQNIDVSVLENTVMFKNSKDFSRNADQSHRGESDILPVTISTSGLSSTVGESLTSNKHRSGNTLFQDDQYQIKDINHGPEVVGIFHLPEQHGACSAGPLLKGTCLNYSNEQKINQADHVQQIYFTGNHPDAQNTKIKHTQTNDNVCDGSEIQNSAPWVTPIERRADFHRDTDIAASSAQSSLSSPVSSSTIFVSHNQTPNLPAPSTKRPQIVTNYGEDFQGHCDNARNPAADKGSANSDIAGICTPQSNEDSLDAAPQDPTAVEKGPCNKKIFYKKDRRVSQSPSVNTSPRSSAYRKMALTDEDRSWKEGQGLCSNAKNSANDENISPPDGAGSSTQPLKLSFVSSTTTHQAVDIGISNGQTEKFENRQGVDEGRADPPPYTIAVLSDSLQPSSIGQTKLSMGKSDIIDQADQLALSALHTTGDQMPSAHVRSMDPKLIFQYDRKKKAME